MRGHSIEGKLPAAPAVLIAIVIGLALSYKMGSTLGVGNTAFAAKVIAGSVAVGIVLWLRTNTWMLIPFCWLLSNRISVLPLPFTVRELGIFAAVGMFFVMCVFKIPRLRPKLEALDLMAWVCVGWVVITFIRHPAGFAFLRSDRVGGKPYLVILMAVPAYFVLSRMYAGPLQARKLPFLLFGASTILGLLGALTFFVPATAPIIAPFYSGVDMGAFFAAEAGEGARSLSVLGKERLGFLQTLGMVGALVSVCLWKPTTVINPMSGLPFVAFTGSLGAIFLSGFRSALGAVIGYYLVSAFIKERALGFFRSMILGAIALSVILVTQGTLIEYPKTMQRALSWLPGNWKVQGGEESTEWRVEMWKIALTTDRYIKDKIFGDGFGFSKRDLEIMIGSAWGGSGFLGADPTKEAFLIQGSFHSGPVSTIRVVGVFGLVLHMVLLFMMAWYAFRLALRAKGTRYEFTSLFLAVPAVMEPFYFVLIFGDYNNALADSLFRIGMMKLVNGSMDRAGINVGRSAPGISRGRGLPMMPAMIAARAAAEGRPMPRPIPRPVPRPMPVGAGRMSEGPGLG